MNDAVVTKEELLEILKSKVSVAGSVENFCETYGVRGNLMLSPRYVTAVLRGERPIGRILLKALGYQKRVVFVKKVSERDESELGV